MKTFKIAIVYDRKIGIRNILNITPFGSVSLNINESGDTEVRHH